MRPLFLHRGGSPYFNMCVEEALQLLVDRGVYEASARVWVNGRSVVIGYSLGPCEEVRCGEARRLGVAVVRRHSGGGAVYHDFGNVNVTIVYPERLGVDEAYRRGTGVMCKILGELGLDCRVENTSDVVVDGYKVSGSAVAVKASSTLFHATLLVEADMGLLRRLLIPRLDRVARGEVTPAKYNPGNLSAIAGVTLGEALGAAVSVLESELGVEPPGGGPLMEASRRVCGERLGDPKWIPVGEPVLEEPGVMG